MNGVEPAKAAPVSIDSFRELMEQVAQLAYQNKDHLLFFRGQARDFKNRVGASSFYPSIYRGERLSRDELALRFDVLQSSGERLVDAFQQQKIAGAPEVKRRKYIQWSILQHYEVCPTPLLDFTQSVRVACSFATLDADGGDAFLYCFGLPYLSNRISVNSEQDLVNIRLLSICPPDALRPYFQEGYLAGTDEVTTDYDSKDELDFRRRLIAKFRIAGGDAFWGRDFPPIPRSALYPDADRMQALCDSIRVEVGTEVEAGQLGRFLQTWSKLEGRLMSMARQRRARVFSVREAIDLLAKESVLPANLNDRVDALRRLHNTAVRQPADLKPGQLDGALTETEELLSMVS
jgi:uncharacterized protein YutE (UPF0331/DUF86 family)